MRRNKTKAARNELSLIPEKPSDLTKVLFECDKLSKRGKRRTKDEHRFEIFAPENIVQLSKSIIDQTYEPSRGKAFITHKPVIREIFAAPYRDRIVHHFLYGVISPWWEHRFIYDSYSCREGKGTSLGVKRMQKFMRKASKGGTKKAYVIKADIAGYFMSLDRAELFKRVLWGLEQQFPKRGFLYDIQRFLWEVIIFDDPVDGVRIAGNKKEWKKLPKRKSLFNQPPGKGIVIGNLTSQLLSNIYLDLLDQRMKHYWKFKYYGRYVDDFFVVVPEEDFERAKRLFRKDIPEFLKSLGLEMHPKKLYIQPVSHGAPFLGRKVYPTRILPDKRTKGNYEQAMIEVAAGERSIASVISYLGMGKEMKMNKLNKKIFDKVGWDYIFEDF